MTATTEAGRAGSSTTASAPPETDGTAPGAGRDDAGTTPWFGVLAGLAGVGLAGAGLLRRRLTDR